MASGPVAQMTAANTLVSRLEPIAHRDSTRRTREFFGSRVSLSGLFNLSRILHGRQLSKCFIPRTPHERTSSMQRKQVSLRIAGSLLGMLLLAGLPISKASA